MSISTAVNQHEEPQQTQPKFTVEEFYNIEQIDNEEDFYEIKQPPEDESLAEIQVFSYEEYENFPIEPMTEAKT